MQSRIEINGKPVNINLSVNAEKALASRTQPLHVAMELYFSCLIRKKVRFFQESIKDDEYRVTENLYVVFQPVMTKDCQNDFEGSEPPMTDFPIVKTSPFVPAWLNIDYDNGEWIGDFGFSPSQSH